MTAVTSSSATAPATDSGSSRRRREVRPEQEAAESTMPPAQPPPRTVLDGSMAAAAGVVVTVTAARGGAERGGGGGGGREERQPVAQSTALLLRAAAATAAVVPYLFALGLLALHCLLVLPSDSSLAPAGGPFPFPFVVQHASAAFVAPAPTTKSSSSGGSRMGGERRKKRRHTAMMPWTGRVSCLNAVPSSSATAAAAALVGEKGKAKGEEEEEEAVWRLEAASAFFPHPRKVDTGGEDACFVLPMDLGVFDGVGGWSVVEEADTGRYARLFANHTATHLQGQRRAGVRQVDHVAALQHALKETDGIGSTTACLASMVPGTDGSIVGLNLGDSGLLLLRRRKKAGTERQGGEEAGNVKDELDDFEPELVAEEEGGNEEEGDGEEEAIGRHRAPFEITFRTRMQTHDFNTPFQLGTNCTDRPEFGQLYFLQAQEGDILLLASDGLFDNLYDQEILQLVEGAQSMQGLATSLAEKALLFSGDPKRVSPWQLSRAELSPAKKKALHPFAWKRKKAEQAALCGLGETGRPIKALGGKVDDITVVVARVLRGRG